MERKPPVKISILEKDESEVSHCWKYCQVFSYIMVIISGVATSLAMGNIQKMFNHECLLYADLAVTYDNWTIFVTPHSASRWGSSAHCSFTQFFPVASVIFAGIWGILFCMCGRGGASSRHLPQAWRIIPPAILFNFIFLVMSCISVGITCGGFASFCASIAPQINASSCDDLIGFVWERYPSASDFYDDVVLAQTGSSFVLAGWTLGFVILLIRVITHADFRVIGTERKASSGVESGSSGGRRCHTQSISSTISNNSPGNSSSGSNLALNKKRAAEDRPLIPLSSSPAQHSNKSSNNNANNNHILQSMSPVSD